MMENVVELARHIQTKRWSFFEGILSDRAIGMMEALDRFGYFTTGLSFLVVSMVLFSRAWYVFSVIVGENPVLAVLGLVHDLLLVIILLELFRTTINFLKTKVITLEPFLYIGVIASTRRILTTGAQVSYIGELTDLIFNRYLMDLGANVLVVVALIVAVYLSRRTVLPAMIWRSENGSSH
ncbi:MAG: phosphate-starvation-inducible PsiE family protein [Nitrospira sp.]|nr:phosphate-starvation-inducible PsiE family protein [Nitrospira sp.]